MPAWRARRASRSSQAVAAFRATLERPHTPDGDPLAQARLAEGMPPPSGEKLIAHLAARTRFFDDAVLAAIDSGTTQIVILGAGYDDRALRFRARSVRFFEVDLPGTQRDKRRRLARGRTDLDGVTFVPADFRSDDTAAALARAGHEASRPTLFLCEGLAIYLDLNVTVRLFTAARSRSTPTSRLAASLATHPDGERSDSVVANANALREHADSEPWQTILPVAGQAELLASAGWTPTQTDQRTRGMLLVLATPIELAHAAAIAAPNASTSCAVVSHEQTQRTSSRDSSHT